MIKSLTLFLFFLTQVFYLVGQANSTDIDSVKIETLSLFLKETYDLSLAYGGDMKSISDVRLIKGDKAQFLSQFEQHPLYEVKLIQDELLIRMRETSLASKSYIIEVLSSVDSKPVELAAVAVLNTSIGDYTDNKGLVTLKIPKHFSNESLEIQMLGFEKRTIAITSLSPYHTISLTPSPYDVGEVIVEDKQEVLSSDEESGKTVLKNNSQLLSAGNIAGEDVLREVQALPGIVGFEDNSVGIQIRGSHYDQTLIRVDGIPIYNAEHYFGVFSNVNPLAVDRLEVYKNNLPITVGARNGGLVDIYSKRDTALEKVRGEIDLNLLSSAAIIEVPFSKQLYFYAAGRSTLGNVNNTGFFSLWNDNIMDNGNVQNFSELSREAILGTVPDFSFYDVQSSLAYHPNEKLNLSFTYFKSDDDLSQESTSSFEERIRAGTIFNEERYSHKEEWGNQGFSVVGKYNLSPKLTFNGVGYYTSYNKNSSTNVSLDRGLQMMSRNFEQSFVSQNVIEEKGIKLNLNHVVSSSSSLNYGIDYIQYNAAVRTSDQGSDRISFREEGSELVPFVELQQGFADDWNFSLGSRFSYYSLTNSWFVSPRINLTKKIENSLLLKASWGRQNQFARILDFENVNRRTLELWALGGKGSVPVSVVDQFMIGGNYKKDRFALDVEFYRRSTDGVLNIALRNPQFTENSVLPDVTTSGYVNYIGTGKTIGGDVMFTYTGKKYGAYLGYTLSRSTESFQQINRGEDLPAQLDRRHQLMLAQRYDFGDWFVSADLTWASGRPYLDLGKIEINDRRDDLSAANNYSRLPDYSRLDFGLGYDFELRDIDFTLKTSLVNALGRDNVTYIQYTFALPADNSSNATQGTNLGNTSNLLDRTLNLSLQMRF